MAVGWVEDRKQGRECQHQVVGKAVVAGLPRPAA